MRWLILPAAVAGCAQPVPPSLPVLDLDLPIQMGVNGAGHDGHVTFALSGQVGAAALTFDGWWSDVTATVDGVPLSAAPVSPGIAPTSLLLEQLPAPAPGTHTLSVHVGPPSVPSRRLSLANRMFTLRDGALRLHARPTANAAVLGIALPLVDGEVHPIVQGLAPDDATVEVFVSLDGRRMLGWEAQPAGQGAGILDMAPFAPKRWPGELWGIDAPALYVVTAVIRGADGAVLDASSERVGVRESTLVNGQLELNGEPSPLLAMRLDPVEDLHETAKGLAEVGANAVEVHGLVAGGRWLSRFDEWGLPVVHMPRCDGNLDRAPEGASTVLAMTTQDAALLRAAASRPAVLAWVCEGAIQHRESWCGSLHADPLGRPILGLDNPALSIVGSEAGTGERRWIFEMGAGGPFVSFEKVAAAYLAVIGPGGPGGVILPPPPMGRDAWAAAWRGATKALGTRPWTSGTYRASSSVVVSGLTPGAPAVIEAPWMTPQGAVADDKGTARIDIWYQGGAVLRIGERRLSVTLTADLWNGVDRVSHALVVDGS